MPYRCCCSPMVLNGFGLCIPPLLKRLGCPPESIHELLDFYHAAEHLQQFAQVAFSEPTVAQTWFKLARSDLKRGRVDDLLNRMQALVQQSSGDRQKTLAREHQYFTTGQQQGRLNYSQVAAIKLPIGSGAIESLIRGCGQSTS